MKGGTVKERQGSYVFKSVNDMIFLISGTEKVDVKDEPVQKWDFLLLLTALLS